MANVKLAYASAANITISLAPGGVGLTSGSARESAAISNTTNLYLDAMVYLAIKLATGTPAQGGEILVYGSASVDGTNFTDNATGSDAAITLRNPTNLVLLQPISAILTPASGALTYKAVIPSVAASFGGLLPPSWSIIIQNDTGLALDSTEANHIKQYVGVYATVV